MNIPTTLDDPTMTLVYILIVIIMTSIITRVIAKLLNKMERFKRDMTAVYLIRDIINYMIYFIALIVILQFFGINLTATLLSLGVVGIAVSLAARDILSNLFSGIILIIGKSIKVGDTIEINNKKGIVEQIQLRTTIVSDDDGIKNHVPNSTLTNNAYLQYKKPEKYRVNILVGLPLNIDIEDFREYIIGKIESYDGIVGEPKPNVFAKAITFEETQVKVSFWIKDFNSKDKYKLKITNEIRKYITDMGENDE
ncbi:MAG: mechanosensitive ion channel [Methanobrevibacter sp.]|nr:mechanosensitive ion channel [Methanobrevibacter sp.]